MSDISSSLYKKLKQVYLSNKYKLAIFSDTHSDLMEKY